MATSDPDDQARRKVGRDEERPPSLVLADMDPLMVAGDIECRRTHPHADVADRDRHRAAIERYDPGQP